MHYKFNSYKDRLYKELQDVTIDQCNLFSISFVRGIVPKATICSWNKRIVDRYQPDRGLQSPCLKKVMWPTCTQSVICNLAPLVQI